MVKKDGGVLCCVIMESEMMVPLSNRRNGSCRRVRSRTQRSAKLGFCDECGRIRWRHGGDYRRDTIRRQEDENETFCARSFLLDDALFSNFERVSNAGSPTCLATRRR